MTRVMADNQSNGANLSTGRHFACGLQLSDGADRAPTYPQRRMYDSPIFFVRESDQGLGHTTSETTYGWFCPKCGRCWPFPTHCICTAILKFLRAADGLRGRLARAPFSDYGPQANAGGGHVAQPRHLLDQISYRGPRAFRSNPTPAAGLAHFLFGDFRTAALGARP